MAIKRCDRCGSYSPDLIMQHEAMIREIAAKGIEYTMNDQDMREMKALFDAMEEMNDQKWQKGWRLGKMCRCGMYHSINMEMIV